MVSDETTGNPETVVTAPGQNCVREVSDVARIRAKRAFWSDFIGHDVQKLFTIVVANRRRNDFGLTLEIVRNMLYTNFLASNHIQVLSAAEPDQTVQSRERHHRKLNCRSEFLKA